MKPPELTILLKDWKADADGLSIEARGAWMEVLTRAVVSNKHGTVSKTPAGWARVFGTDQERADKIIFELKADGCARITVGPRNVTITSRRMEAERKMRESQTLRKRKQRATPSHGDVTAPFERFWAAWPKHSRKTQKAQCWEKWEKDGLDSNADHVIAVVAAMKRCQQWRDKGGQYIPAPLVWLNQQRWDCDLQDVVRPTPGAFRPPSEPTRLHRELQEIIDKGGTLNAECQKMYDYMNPGNEESKP